MNFPYITYYVGYCVVELPKLICIGMDILEKEKEGNDPALTLILNYYYKFLNIFNKCITNELPLHRLGINHIIKLRDKNCLPVLLLYAYCWSSVFRTTKACWKHLGSQCGDRS